MPEGNDYSSIGPLNATAQQEGFKLVGQILLVMLMTVIGVYIIGAIANAL